MRQLVATVAAQVIILFLSVLAICSGQELSSSVHSIVTEHGESRSKAYSSCVFIGGRDFVTNFHVIRGLTGHCVVGDEAVGVNYLCKVVASDEQADIAVIRTDVDVIASPAKIATTAPTIGDVVTAFGYGQSYHRFFDGAGGDPLQLKPVPREWSGRVRESLSRAYTFDGAAITGDSGGGVFNARGELVGPLFGTWGGMTFAVKNQELQTIIRASNVPR